MRALVLFLALASTAAAQGVPAPPPITVPGVNIPGMNVTQAGVDEAIAAALAETRGAAQDSATAEVRAAMAEADASARPLSGSAPLTIQMPDGSTVQSGVTVELLPAGAAPTRVATRAQTYPTLFDGYGFQGDGFPERSMITGTVIRAGSLRLCRQGRPPVSRWLQVRLSGMPEGVPPVHITVAIQCDEWAAKHYLGRRVRIDAIKSSPEQEIRMADRDLPESDSPLYLTDPTRVVVE